MNTQEAKILLLLGKTKVITDLIIDRKLIKDGPVNVLINNLNDEIYNLSQELK